MPDAPALPTETPEAVLPTPDAPAQEPAETDWKAEARKWEQRAKENRAKLDEATPKLSEYDRLVEASKTDLERAREAETRWQTEAETWRKAAISNRVEALAADFADPSDAVAALTDQDYLDAGGQIDEARIRADLAAVLERKPHWRKADGAPAGPRVPAPNPAQGSGGGRPVADPAQEFAAILQGQMNAR